MFIFISRLIAKIDGLVTTRQLSIMDQAGFIPIRKSMIPLRLEFGNKPFCKVPRPECRISSSILTGVGEAPNLRLWRFFPAS
jgi:hypothetical protein